MLEVRLSSDGYSNSQGHYIPMFILENVNDLKKRCLEYAKKFGYLDGYINVQIWESHFGGMKVYRKLLIDWHMLSIIYPQVSILELFWLSNLHILEDTENNYKPEFIERVQKLSEKYPSIDVVPHAVVENNSIKITKALGIREGNIKWR